MSRSNMIEGGRPERNYISSNPTDIAVRYANELSAPSLVKPLQEFLQDAVTVQGLEAVVLALWREPKAFTFISVYMLTNGELPRTSSNSETPTAAITRIYAPFHQSVRSVDLLLHSELYFVNTCHRDVRRTVTQLRKELTSESFHSLVTSTFPKIG